MDKYKLIGPAYDALSKLYSGDAIHQCKVCMLRPDTITTFEANAYPAEQRTKVLVAGGGHGIDAIHAAKLGAEVTVVELSPTMQHEFQEKLSLEPDCDVLNINLVPGDIMKFEDYGAYDLVVANFFLTVFERQKMNLVLAHLSKHCKPEGQLIIGDFKPAEGNVLSQFAQNAYWYAAACSFFFMTGNPVHGLYDYAPLLKERDFDLLEQINFSMAGKELYCSLRAQKKP